MGVSSSKVEEDKALQLCHERKKFVRQALDGRCSLAAAHVAYIQSLKTTGKALRSFIDPESTSESLVFNSNVGTPEPYISVDKSPSSFSFSSRSPSNVVDVHENISPVQSSSGSRLFHANYMKSSFFSPNKVEEKPVPVVTERVISSSAQENMPSSSQKSEPFQFEASLPDLGTPQWDYFQFLHPIDHQFSPQEQKEETLGTGNVGNLRQLSEEEERVSEVEDEAEKTSLVDGESDDSQDEFDDPSVDSLVRSFENLNRGERNSGVVLDTKPLLDLDGDESCSPKTSSPAINFSMGAKKFVEREEENGVSLKELFLSIKDIESLFIKASESGKEVPRMLEANKLHFRPILDAEGRTFPFTYLKGCFSCRAYGSIVQEESQIGTKYLTWNRTISSRSSSSKNLLSMHCKDDKDELGGQFENSCMISGSHASTLDRLYAWERKLYDEVKASEMVRREYDLKCKILRQLEFKGESSYKIDKTRAMVKDLHSRIRVAIQRIDSISKQIEELRDKELQPQLEELISGLARMWEVMLDCHRQQFRIISSTFHSGNGKVSLQSESRRQTVVHLETELSSFSSAFTKWVSTHKSYLEAINSWLLKCVVLPEKPLKRKRWRPPPSIALRSFGPPVYATCGTWFDQLDSLPAKEVADSIKGLAAEATRFLPRQEPAQAKGSSSSPSRDDRSESTVSILHEDACVSGLERFRSSLEGFLGQLSNFAACSVKMYADLDTAIRDAKANYELLFKPPCK